MRMIELVGASRGASTEPRGLPLSLRTVPPPAPSSLETEAARLYSSLVSWMGGLGDAVRRRKTVQLGPLSQVVRRLAGNPDLTAQLFHHTFEPYLEAELLDHHCANVVVLSLHTAHRLPLDEEARVLLGVSAALHDLGMYSLPEELLRKRSTYTVAEKNLIEGHPKVGYGLLRDLGGSAGPIAEVVHQEHEREDGHGYPLGLVSNRIHPSAKVLGVVDSFEAMVHPRPHRSALCPVEAVRLLVRSAPSSLASTAVRACVAQATPFPPTTWVQLSDGRLGQVARVRPRAPLRPMVRVWNKEGAPEEAVDLDGNPLLRIAEVVPRGRVPRWAA